MPNNLEHFASPYSLGNANEPVELSRETINFIRNKTWTTGTGSVNVRFLPSPRITIDASFPVLRPLSGLKSEQLGLPDRGIEVPGVTTSFKMTMGAGGSGTSIRWIVLREPLVVLGDETTVVKRVVFHLVNFPEVNIERTTVESSNGRQVSIRHFILAWGSYEVHLRSLHSTPDSAKTLRDEGGYAITHLGEIRRTDANEFSVSDIASFLRGLELFFSFCRGHWVSPVLRVGFDSNCAKVWEHWNSPKGESYLWTSSWLNPMYGQNLEVLFPGFMNLWANQEWQQALEEAIYWYLNSNYSPRGIDAGVILAQAALERLSFANAVKNKVHGGFRKITAADKLRELFSSLNLPVTIPSVLTSLSATAMQHRWSDAPQGLTEIRNEIVHPEHKKRGQFNDVLVDAWDLSLWYIEMTVLRLSAYSGDYSNRLVPRNAVGQVEKVPWA